MFVHVLVGHFETAFTESKAKSVVAGSIAKKSS